MGSISKDSRFIAKALVPGKFINVALVSSRQGERCMPYRRLTRGIHLPLKVQFDANYPGLVPWRPGNDALNIGRDYMEGTINNLKVRFATHRREDSRAEDDRQYDESDK